MFMGIESRSTAGKLDLSYSGALISNKVSSYPKLSLFFVFFPRSCDV